ncbi:MAG: APC family permease [Rhodobacteraceae bacterium]|nr:APC family permease [Paracoccaceae bacterium]
MGGTDEARPEPVALRRSVGLAGLVLYGLGVTVGAGIYVLVGEAVVRAGPYAPAAFLLAAIVMAFTAASYAELSTRIPQAAGDAVYVEAAFGRPWLTVVVGLAVLAEAVIAAAAIAVGAAGYLAELVALPRPLLIAAVVLSMAAVAARGIRESILVAGAMTVIEVAGLAVIVALGVAAEPAALAELPGMLVPPPGDAAAVSGVLGAGLIAFFAFIGFDDIVNLVEEARHPRRDLPRAIAITLVLVTLIYVLVAFVAVRAIQVAEIAATDAPISLLFERLTGMSPLAITLIAIMATMNGVVIILVMAARVAYGMARAGRLPGWVGRVSTRTRTPLRATVMVAAVVLGLAVLAPLGALAQLTSALVLAVFFMVNVALAGLKLRGGAGPAPGFSVPAVVPLCGAVSCLGLLAGAVASGG